jgi:outer membrane protein OmpA-like peptidoglycan-associated protein
MTWSRRISCLVSLVALTAGLAACSGAKNAQTAPTDTPAASPAASAQSPVTVESASPSAEAASGAPVAETSPETGGSPEASGASPGAETSPAAPTPQPTPSADPNLLLPENGTIVRAWPAGTKGNSPKDYAYNGISLGDDAKPPYAVVFELPGVATLSSVAVAMRAAPEGQSPGATVAVSTTSATDGFRDLGTVKAAAAGSSPPPPLAANVRARWVRITLDDAAKEIVSGITALGTLDGRPSAALLPAGIFVEARPYDGQTGAFIPDPGPSTDPWYVRMVSTSGSAGGPPGLSAQRCYDGRLGDAYPGALEGRTWSWRSGTESARLTVNDEGTIVSNRDTYYTRTDRLPKWCKVQDGGGKGSTNALLLESSDQALYPIGDKAADAPGFHFDVEGAGMFDPLQLSHYSVVMMNGLCDTSKFLSPQVALALTDWVAAGHKLMIYDADMCGKDTTNYAFLPYPFKSDNPGANGAKGDRLIEVENDQLGSLDTSDKAHFFDPAPFAAGSNQLGDANTVTSHDTHWCGHLFGTNVNHVNGFMQMYAPYGKGLIVYDGLDHDDDGNPYYQRIRLLELAAAVDGNNPCTQNVSLSFLIEPNREATFVPGKAVTKTFSMELLANQGWKGHVALTTSGDFTGLVTPSVLDVNGGTTPLKIAVAIPASAKPGQYALIVNGNGGGTASAQATISLNAAVPIVKQLKVQRRIRLYGIHFDVDSARIQPRSEPVIAEVAAIMRENPQWHFRIEGHTDSDGGVEHNQVLSLHRAQSVIDDLVKRYHIARSRLVAAGFGLSRPVASNATAAGKALNRRVELVRL